MTLPDIPPPFAAEAERLRSAFEGYAAVDIGAILDALSPGAGANRRKAERIEALLRLLLTPDFAARALGTLSPLGRRLLRVASGDDRLPLAALLLAGQDAAHDEATVRRTLRELLDQALLIVEQSASSGIKVSLDLDQPTAPFIHVWMPQVVREILQTAEPDLPPLQALTVEPVAVEQGSFAALRRDLYLTLRFLKGAGLRLTRLGEPHRADLRKLYAALQPGGVPVRSEAAEQLEGRVTFLLRLLAATSLTVEEGTTLRAIPEIEVFLNESEYEAARLLFDAWLDLDWDEFGRLPQLAVEPWSYSGPGDMPNAGRIAAARRTITELLTTAPMGWLAIVALSERLRQTAPEFLIDRVPEYPPSHYNYYFYYGQDNYYGARQAVEQIYYRGFVRADMRSRDRRLRKDQDWAEVEGAFVTQVLAESLRWLGVVDVGTLRPGDECPTAVRLTDLGQRLLRQQKDTPTPRVVGVALIVQPNFEVLVLDALGNLDLVSRLDAFADSRSLDRAAVYTLTRTSIVRGLAAGWTEEQIVATLEGAAAAPLPQNVRQTITDWAREFERVHLLRDAAILEAPDEATLNRWLADPTIAAGVTRQLTPTIALLGGKATNTVAAALERRQVETWSINYALDPPQVLNLPRPDLIAIPWQDDDPYLRYRLERFADRQPSDDGTSVHYRISPESLARAKGAGQPIDEILSFLGFKARGGLSPDDVLTLRGWSGYYQPFQYAQVRAVELPTTANWGDLSRVKVLRPLILRILTANLALVSEEHWPQLEAALRARGITTQPGLSVQPQAEKRSAAQRTAASLGLPTGRDLIMGASASGSGGSRREGLQSLNGRQLVDFVEAALEASQPLIIEYQKPGERRATVRTVEPYELEMRGGSYYLHAFCRHRQDDRVFRLKNVLGVAHAPD